MPLIWDLFNMDCLLVEKWRESANGGVSLYSLGLMVLI